jgi:hypothetical protein
MRKLITLIVITATIACNTKTEFKEVKETPKKDNTLDSLYAYKDSLMLAYGDFKQAQVDSIAKLYR